MQLGIESSIANLLPLLTVEQCSSEPLEMTEASALKRASLLAGAILFSFCPRVASAHGSNICQARTQPMRLCIPTRFRSAARWPLKDPSLCHWASSASADSVWARRIQIVPGSSALEKSSESAVGTWSSKLEAGRRSVFHEY